MIETKNKSKVKWGETKDYGFVIMNIVVERQQSVNNSAWGEIGQFKYIVH